MPACLLICLPLLPLLPSTDYAPQYETSSLYCADEFNKFLVSQRSKAQHTQHAASFLARFPLLARPLAHHV